MHKEMKESLLNENGQPNVEHKAMPLEGSHSLNHDEHVTKWHDKILNKKVIWTTIVTFYSTALLIFSIACFVNRILLAVGGKVSGVYLGLTFTGDALGLFLGSFGITTVFCYSLPKLKIYMILLIFFSLYMFIIGLLGNLWWNQVDPNFPYIITTIVPCMLIQFGGCWASFNLCWAAVSQEVYPQNHENEHVVGHGH